MKSQGFVFRVEEEGMGSYDFFYHREARSEYLIGRTVGDVKFDTLQVQLQDRAVSRKHCRIFHHARCGWMVEDKGSTNGTWVRQEGHHFAPFKRVTEAVPVDSGSVLRVGNTELTLQSIPLTHTKRPPSVFSPPLAQGVERSQMCA
ncbi:MAG: FHA domain-containing protein [Magnetococcales bacterium]|nr:FHA domain-containing protein [Magnetococcales bacterium]